MGNTDYQKLNKEELERQKLVAEVRDSNRPFLVRHFSSAVIMLLTAASLFVGFYTGLFDAKKENLELDIKRFEDRKIALNDSISVLKSDLDSYSNRMDSLDFAHEEAVKNEEKAKAEVLNLIAANDTLSDSFESIQNQNIEDKEKIQELTELLSKYEKSSKQNIEKITTLNQQLQDLSGVYARLAHINKNNIGKIEVINNTNDANFDAIIGKVVDENNLPIPNAAVLFEKSGRGPFPKTSDAAGDFFIKFKYDNYYKGRTFPVIISKEGYETVSGFVVVGSTIKVRMKKSS